MTKIIRPVRRAYYREDFEDPLEAVEYIDGLICDYKEGYLTATQVLALVETMKISHLNIAEKIHG